MRVVRIAATQLLVLVGVGVAVSALIAVLVHHQRFLSEFGTVAIFVGAVFLAFGAAGAGGMPVGFRVLENTRLPGLGTVTLTDDEPMRVSSTALLFAAGAIVVALGILA